MLYLLCCMNPQMHDVMAKLSASARRKGRLQSCCGYLSNAYNNAYGGTSPEEAACNTIHNAYAFMPHRLRNHRHTSQGQVRKSESYMLFILELLIAHQFVVQAQLREVSNLDSLCAQEDAAFGGA